MAVVHVYQYLKGDGSNDLQVSSAAIWWFGGWSDEHIGEPRIFFLQEEQDMPYFEEACSPSVPVEEPQYGVTLEEVLNATSAKLAEDVFPTGIEDTDEGAFGFEHWHWWSIVIASVVGLASVAGVWLVRRRADLLV
jgi:hypothetical protein